MASTAFPALRCRRFALRFCVACSSLSTLIVLIPIHASTSIGSPDGDSSLRYPLGTNALNGTIATPSGGAGNGGKLYILSSGTLLFAIVVVVVVKYSNPGRAKSPSLG